MPRDPIGSRTKGLEQSPNRFGIHPARAFAAVMTGMAILLIPAAARATDGPKAVVAGTVEDLGEVPRGKTILRNFRIENTGTTALEIMAKANCGCTIPAYDRTIPPGKSGKFTIELRTLSLTGKFRKTVDVTTNDSTLPKFVLELRGESIPAVEIRPDTNFPIPLAWSEVTEKQYLVKTAQGVRLLEAVSADPTTKPTIEPVETGSYRLVFRIPADTPAGSRASVVVLKTDAEYEKSIPLTIRLEKGIVASPPAMQLFGAGGKGQGAVIVRSASGPLRITKAYATDENLKVEAKPIQENAIFQVSATETGPRPNGPGAKPRKIVLETDDPHQPRFELPVR